MQQAFMKLPEAVLGTPLGQKVFSSLEHSVVSGGRRAGKATLWKANLSYKTYQRLKNQGVMQ